MPTLKQVRFHIKRITYYRRQLGKALNAAHDVGIISYEKYNEESPCYSLYEMENRVENTTQKQIADAFNADVSKEVGW